MTARRKRRRRRGSGLLTLAILAFLGSALLRLAGAGPALAREVGAMMPHDATTAADAATCTQEADIAPILERLQEREGRVVSAESRLDQKQQALAAAETRVGERLAELRAAEESLRATLALSNTAAEDDLSKLTSVYESMKPKDAVPLFEAMESGFAAGFLGRMRSDAAGAIMAGMSAEKAYAISVILAGRNAGKKHP